LQITCNASSSGDLPVSADTLGDRAATVRNYAFASFWVQLPLTIVSAGILFFAISFSKAASVLVRVHEHQSIAQDGSCKRQAEQAQQQQRRRQGQQQW
jgi:hypothetical protein